jgi:hypothetical protein
MKFRADIMNCQDDGDIILSVCQCEGSDIEYEVIIQRNPPEYEAVEDIPGPKITCEQFGLDLVPGPEAIDFTDDIMTIVLSWRGNIEVDISHLTEKEQKDLKKTAKALFRNYQGNALE